jgi:hypothetical protein
MWIRLRILLFPPVTFKMLKTTYGSYGSGSGTLGKSMLETLLKTPDFFNNNMGVAALTGTVLGNEKNRTGQL